MLSVSNVSSVSRYDDRNTLHVISGAASNKDLRNAVIDSIASLERKTRKKYPSKVVANLVYDREGVPYGFGYLYVSNSEVYNMLLGKNCDGSAREKVIDRSLTEEFTFLQPTEYLDWVEESSKVNIEPLPSLLPLKPFRYTRHQKVIAKKLLSNLKEGCAIKIDPDLIDVNKCTFVVSPARVKPVDEDKYMKNMLCARGVPHWIEKHSVYNVFKDYAKNSSKPQSKSKNKTTSHQKEYPIVTVNRKNKLCFVEFDPGTRDAQFALLMTKKVYFKNKRTSASHTLVFGHAFKPKPKQKIV